MQLLTNVLVDISTNGWGNFKCRRQCVANWCRQASCVDATVDVDLQRIAGSEHDGPLTFKNLVLNRTVAGHALQLPGARLPVADAAARKISGPYDVGASLC